MNKEKKIPEFLLNALVFFSGIFGFTATLLVGGYCFLADKRETPKKCTWLSLGIAVVFQLITILLNFIGLFTYIEYDVYNWISVIKQIAFAVFGFLSLFGIVLVKNSKKSETVEETESNPESPKTENDTEDKE